MSLLLCAAVQVELGRFPANVTFYAVEGSSVPTPCNSAAPPPSCAACNKGSTCQSLATTATAGYVLACVSGKCTLLLLGPALAPLNENNAQTDADSSILTYTTALSASSSVSSVTLLASIHAPAGAHLHVLAYLAGSVCTPGTAGSEFTSPGVRAGPLPDAIFSGNNRTQVALDGNSSLFDSVIVGAACSVCAPGTATAQYASGTCTPCASGTSQPAAGATACVQCTAGTYQPSLGATKCVACSSSTPQTLLLGAEYATACFAAEVGIESAWVVGQSLALSVFWSLRPPVDAGVTDIVAVFLVSPNTPGYERRQLAWTYTSVPSAPEDYSGGGNPGADSVSAGSILLTVPSAGEGTYAVRFFRNSSAPSIQGLVPPGGAILASATYFAAGGIPSPTPPNGMQALPLESPVATFPKDLGLEVDSGGLVCPAGTESTSQRAAGMPFLVVQL